MDNYDKKLEEFEEVIYELERNVKYGLETIKESLQELDVFLENNDAKNFNIREESTKEFYTRLRSLAMFNEDDLYRNLRALKYEIERIIL